MQNIPSPSADNIQKPESATSASTGFIGFIAFVGSLWLMYEINLSPITRTIFSIGACALIMILWETIVFQTHRRESTGLDWARWNFSPKRCAIKLWGFGITIAALSTAYYIFPVYHAPQYQTAWDAALLLLPYILPLSLIYIAIVDGFMRTPEDGYYHAGLIALGHYTKADKNKINAHMRSWLIKGFFIPLMFLSLVSNIDNIPLRLDQLEKAIDQGNIILLAMVSMIALFTIDLIFTVCGYLFSSRLIDTHERSSEPTMLGWVVAIICYPPFLNFFDKSYLTKGPPPQWNELSSQYPIFVGIWAGAYILCLAVYAWATMAFGLRFSNLTHRGIITSGPYRFTKHPAYISKNISWWLMAAPFLTFMNDPVLSVKTCIILLIINWIYYLRAVTEERHLSQDQTYRDYAAWMDQHGIFRRLRAKIKTGLPAR